MRVELGAPVLIAARSDRGIMHIVELTNGSYPIKATALCGKVGTVVLFSDFMVGKPWCPTCKRKGPRVHRAPILVRRGKRRGRVNLV